ncbi:MAG TPA: MarR family transcriptional regulator [Acidimicrobiia bacterium]|jgi:DNA-binding MarR family transcriptional regulator
MSDDDLPPWYDDLILPVMLTLARRPYGAAIRRALHEAGFTDMPRTGARLVGGIARNGPSVGNTAAHLGVSKQAASQLVDTLVERGYVTREPDADDRRRIVVDLTDRGREAAKHIRGAVERVDRALEKRVGKERIADARTVLASLAELSRSDR